MGFALSWIAVKQKSPDAVLVGAELEGDVKDITKFGLFVGLPGDIDGLVHLSDLDRSRPG